MRSIPETIPDLIDALGGAVVISGARNLPYTTVASWKARGAIPAREWPGLVDMARQRKTAGVTLKRLSELHASRRAARSKNGLRARAA